MLFCFVSSSSGRNSNCAAAVVAAAAVVGLTNWKSKNRSCKYFCWHQFPNRRWKVEQLGSFLEQLFSTIKDWNILRALKIGSTCQARQVCCGTVANPPKVAVQPGGQHDIFYSKLGAICVSCTREAKESAKWQEIWSTATIKRQNKLHSTCKRQALAFPCHCQASWTNPRNSVLLRSTRNLRHRSTQVQSLIKICIGNLRVTVYCSYCNSSSKKLRNLLLRGFRHPLHWQSIKSPLLSVWQSHLRFQQASNEFNTLQRKDKKRT